jgi:uncharacterized protein YqhQ
MTATTGGELRRSSIYVTGLLIAGIVSLLFGHQLIFGSPFFSYDLQRQYWSDCFQSLGVGLIAIGIFIYLEARLTDRFNEE